MTVDSPVHSPPDGRPIPLVDLGAQMREIENDVWPELKDLFARTAFIGGAAVDQFESAFAKLIDTAHCIGVGNGTDAVELALRAVGVTAGGEVIMPANTFIATAEAAWRIGARPVPVDVDPQYLLIDPDRVAEALSERTQAIVPVHLFGQVAPVERLQQIAATAGIPIVEDAAQSQGASRLGRPAGSLGTVAATSFYPGKNLGAAGDGGAVMTNDATIARTVRVIAAHGSERKYDHEILGMNSRLDAVQAVVLSAKLKRLMEWNEQRRAAAARYSVLLAGVDRVQAPSSDPDNVDVWHLYVVQVEDRDRVLADLNAAGIGAGIHYPTPIHLTGAMAGYGYPEGICPVAEHAADRILSLPIHPHITAAQQEYVVERLAAAVLR